MTTAESKTSHFRGDIEGLRAVAVIAVLLWHAKLSWLPGGFVGVDVFFVISGFLITRMLLGQIRATGRISLLDFYARRARRLLPAACVVLLVSLVLTYLFLPRIRWADTAWDAIASSLYVVNWRLAEQATDYLSAGLAPSIVQHYWSLSVEEQFYLVWPVLMLALTWAGLRRRHLLLPALLVVLGASFAWSVHLSQASPQSAYFVTTTRGWELALGGVVAVGLPWLARLPKAVAGSVGWLGLAAIVAATTAITNTTPFPGYAALLPTLGAAGVIVGGAVAGREGPALLLDTRPARAVGVLSYSLYLWHWPLLVVAEAKWGALSTPAALAVVAASALPAWLTYRYVENPIRHARRWRKKPAATLRTGLLATASTALAAMLFVQLVVWPANRADETAGWSAPGSSGPGASAAMPTLGAAVLRDQPHDDPNGAPVDRVAALWPRPAAVRDDVASSYASGCHQPEEGDEALACRFGPADATFRVALVGDSHAAQWVPAFEDLAVAHKWQVSSYTKSSCPLAEVRVPIGASTRPYDSCGRWNENVLAALTGADRPDLVVATSSYYRIMRGDDVLTPQEGGPGLIAGLRASWQALAAAGPKVVVLRDTPYPGVDIADCVSAHTEELTRCAFARGPALAANAVHEEAAAGLAGVRFVDLTDAICPTDPCAAVIGQVVVYRDTNHLTATYARTLASRLYEALDDTEG